MNHVSMVWINGVLQPMVFQSPELVFESVKTTYSNIDHAIENVPNGWRVSVEGQPDTLITTKEVQVKRRPDHF